MASATIAGNGFTEKTGEADVSFVGPQPWEGSVHASRSGGSRYQLVAPGLFDPGDPPSIVFAGAFTAAIDVEVRDTDTIRFTTPTAPLATRTLVTIRDSAGAILWIDEFTYTN